MEHAVEQVVSVMRDRYHERLYVPELAAETYFSPFHFTRIFRRDTGVTPCQYLTAVRLFEAKRLLLNTSLSVADIACRVGYPGVGTFTTRFSKLVGVSPGHYRRLPADAMLTVADDVYRLPRLPIVLPRQTGCGATLWGSVHLAPSSRLVVGVFDAPIPQGPPVRWTVSHGPEWHLDGLPAGERTVIAVAEGQRSILVGTSTPIRFGTGTVRVDLELHRPLRTDPPFMVPLGTRAPELDQIAA